MISYTSRSLALFASITNGLSQHDSFSMPIYTSCPAAGSPPVVSSRASVTAGQPVSMGPYMSIHAESTTNKALPGLPGDCWVLICLMLPPRDSIRARSVCRQWHEVLTGSDICRHLLRLFFPHCREVRLDMLYNHIDDLPHMPHNLRAEVECRAQGGTDWSKTFAAVARRYHHLQNGTPREYLKLPMPDVVDHTIYCRCMCGDGHPGHQCIRCSFVYAQCGEFFWMDAFRTSLHLTSMYPTGLLRTPDPMWCYSQEDALLVYPAGWLLEDGATPAVNWTKVDCESQSKADTFRHHFSPPMPSCEGFFYRLFDPETGEHISVPFDVRGRIIRRVRLAQGLLVLEWVQVRDDKPAIYAEKVKIGKGQKNRQNAWFHSWVGNAHMATVFEVVRTPLSPDMKRYRHRRWTWDVRFRWEWKLPSGDSPPANFRQEYDTPGGRYHILPRFLSAHTATHYALLIWGYGGKDGVDRFIRQLYVWNICQGESEGPSPIEIALSSSDGQSEEIYFLTSAPTTQRVCWQPFGASL